MTAPANFPSHAIAIIGMAARFPKAASLAEFWRNLAEGRECITRFSENELRDGGVPAELLENPRYVGCRGIIDGRDLFDAGFFGINPREAELTDPQQRLLLECAWEALEDAGYDPERTPGAVGVFAGVAMNTYLLEQVIPGHKEVHPGAIYQAFIGNDKDFCATRLSYKLGLRGPSINIQTACSTSLAAVHQACQSLLTFQSDMALAGAAAVEATRAHGYLFGEGMIMSPDGHCRPFDADAQGTVPGEGVAIVVLKRLEDALADRDPIRAVILGSALNNDGALKAGFTAPSVDGQHDVIAMAQSMARVSADSIGYVEAHGTATPLGDPIEVEALTRAFRETTSRVGYCALGSVKSNLGHTDTVSGMAGLTKTVLALEHGQIPPSLHFTKPNPALHLPESPFFVATQLLDWPAVNGPRRAGVSSFGIGGTNAHVVLEQAPPVEYREDTDRVQVLTLSARTPAALDALTTRLQEHLREHPELRAGDVGFTLQEGRRAWSYRRTILCRNRDEALSALNGTAPHCVATDRAEQYAPTVAFMFSGQGAQYVGMGAELYQRDATFRGAVDACHRILAGEVSRDIRDVMFGTDTAHQLTSTDWAQPALFTLEYALAQLWMARGVRPTAMIGHSIGEYVAATLAGVIPLDDALRLVAARGRHMAAMPPGAMTVVPLAEEAVAPRLGPMLSIAAVNGRELCVVSGPTEDIEAFERQLATENIEPRRLHTSHAFHSAMMEPALAAFREDLARVRFQAPSLPYVSNLTGTWITPEQAVDPEYYVRHIRSTVRFAEGVAALIERGHGVLLEIGPGRALASLARAVAGHPALVATSLRHAEESVSDDEAIGRATAALWSRGVPIDWHVTREEPRHRVALPTYPFEGQRYWLDAARSVATPVTVDPLIKRKDLTDWFYVPSWTRYPLPPNVVTEDLISKRPTLLFLDDLGIGESLAGRLTSAGCEVVTVARGEAFDGTDHDFLIRPDSADDYVRLLAAIRARGIRLGRVVHLWSLGRGSLPDPDAEMTSTYYSLMFLVQALGDHGMTGIDISIVSSELHDVLGDEQLRPRTAVLLGPCRVIPIEYPTARCRNVDIVLSPTGVPERWLVSRLLEECVAGRTDTVVALRNGHRWVQSFQPMPLESTGQPLPLREYGVYLITGGFGGIGQVLARYLAESVAARLILVGRTAPPDRGGWDKWLAEHPHDDAISEAIRAIRSIEACGGQVVVASCDVSNAHDVARLVAEVTSRFGLINGVIHAAGVPGGALIEMASVEGLDSVLAAKVAGTEALDRALSAHQPDWMLLCSSITSILVIPGVMDYCAANAFLDAWAHARRKAGLPVTSVSWDVWQETGMAMKLKVPPHREASKREHLRQGLTNSEGIEIFRRVLATPLPHVVVSTRNLHALLEAPAVPPAAETAASGEETRAPDYLELSAARRSHERPLISTAFIAPDTPVERELAAIWQELLGISPIGVRDNFFELGGHSLLATQVLSRIRAKFHIQLPLRALFDAATIADLAAHVANVQWTLQSAVSANDSSDREEFEL